MTEEEVKMLANDGGTKFRVWWLPQIPMQPFHAEVPDYKTAALLADVLAQYDLFQFDHNVKPDYANMGSVEISHPALTEGEWREIEEDEAADFGWVDQ